MSIVTDYPEADHAGVVRRAVKVVDTRNATPDVRRGREKVVPT
jgi:hypothetical protein